MTKSMMTTSGFSSAAKRTPSNPSYPHPITSTAFIEDNTCNDNAINPWLSSTSRTFNFSTFITLQKQPHLSNQSEGHAHITAAIPELSSVSTQTKPTLRSALGNKQINTVNTTELHPEEVQRKRI
eukprot:TRINITY_DN7710_c0_g2_i1.p1 TRINITY_DN7710_c0_g2~~TRINITY_DN7710_c0_g2_i1.p1  ORF type:complete len:125 (+),score=2.55 TRINITY_DN7710_c0_g2_i1:78-452(+)